MKVYYAALREFFYETAFSRSEKNAEKAAYDYLLSLYIDLKQKYGNPQPQDRYPVGFFDNPNPNSFSEKCTSYEAYLNEFDPNSDRYLGDCFAIIGGNEPIRVVVRITLGTKEITVSVGYESDTLIR